LADFSIPRLSRTHRHDRLLRAATEALTPNSTEHLQIVKDLLEDHLKAAREIVQDRAILETLERQIEKDCIRLKSFLEAAQVSWIFKPPPFPSPSTPHLSRANIPRTS
jgi:hypothetical protein